MSAAPLPTLMVVPTGIGCEIGGYAGDALPSARLLAAAAANKRALGKASPAYPPISQPMPVGTTIRVGSGAALIRYKPPPPEDNGHHRLPSSAP